METQANTTQVSVAKGIDAARLEKELNAVWAEMSASKGDGQGAGVVRACVLNLIVYVAGEDERAEGGETLETLLQRHPCPAILLVAHPASPEAPLAAPAATRG